jgi:hypothetical protein
MSVMLHPDVNYVYAFYSHFSMLLQFILKPLVPVY